MSQDQRRSPRIDATQSIQIFDLAHEAVLGNLVNISTGGLMLLTSEDVPMNHVFQLEMTIRFSDDSERSIQFGAESLWAQETATLGHQWVGFHIIDISEENQAVLDRMIEE